MKEWVRVRSERRGSGGGRIFVDSLLLFCMRGVAGWAAGVMYGAVGTIVSFICLT